jgi:RHS repeat-associated protein
LDTIVRRTRGNGTQLTYAPTTVAGGDGGDQYTGLDRFGRVVDQNWINTSTGTPFDRIQYAYDADSNVLYQNNLVNSAYSELFSPDNGAAQNAQYDALNRLLGFARGTLSASHGSGTPLDTVSSPSATEGWTLDALGNWTSYTNGSTTQTRDFNARNEITSISGVSTPTYDADGNMVIDPNGDKYFYNEWNQITKVENSSGTVLETYMYDAEGRRISITNVSTGVTTDLYYSGSNVIEERQSGTVTAQYVWGLGYVNDLVLRDDNSTSGSLGVSGSGLGRRIYVEQDANYDVTSLTDTSGNVLERFSYDPYGNMIVLTGTTTWTTTTDSFNWVYTWQGGRLDQVTGFIHFGMNGWERDYSPSLGVWIEQDINYADSANLYQAMDSNPVSETDPTAMGAGEEDIEEERIELDEFDRELERVEEDERAWEGMHTETAAEQAARQAREAAQAAATRAAMEREAARRRFQDAEDDWLDARNHLPPGSAARFRALRRDPLDSIGRLFDPAAEQPWDDDGDPCEQSEHYLHRPYLRNSTVDRIPGPKTNSRGQPLDPNTRAIMRGKSVIGHKYGQEEWRWRNWAESHGLTQAQYNDLMNNPSLYQYEDQEQNQNHEHEMKGGGPFPLGKNPGD